MPKFPSVKLQNDPDTLTMIRRAVVGMMDAGADSTVINAYLKGVFYDNAEHALKVTKEYVQVM
jgi:hypothetical protein